MLPLKLAAIACLFAASIEALIPLNTRQLSASASHDLASYSLHSSRRGLFGIALQVRGGDLSDDESDFDIGSEEDDASDSDEALSEDESDAQEESGAESDADEAKPEASAVGPVKLVIKTNLNCPISDQTLEFTASGKRTVESLKQGKLLSCVQCCLSLSTNF